MVDLAWGWTKQPTDNSCGALISAGRGAALRRQKLQRAMKIPFAIFQCAVMFVFLFLEKDMLSKLSSAPDVVFLTF
ncbi:uncharacterized protein SPSK_06811 [Sporothrix schenckii 1099-18]|uniref:Uncharacterized protein n=1 Tax=Sporothrix schenckii 1099-18 TaxID=1397361 RepID=A0A0F2MKB6_SPOSC|nr:uncharacterized protein SPSK_06811 [Sporothrix schenckii 1099-18]KJR89494.1 hypothetical protein SPSK_06811 [Sporothrix schenckii 1099-18]